MKALTGSARFSGYMDNDEYIVQGSDLRVGDVITGMSAGGPGGAFRQPRRVMPMPWLVVGKPTSDNTLVEFSDGRQAYAQHSLHYRVRRPTTGVSDLNETDHADENAARGCPAPRARKS